MKVRFGGQSRRGTSGGLFSFPHPVNEVSARLVAGGVTLMVVATLVFDVPWMMVVIAYGFVARVLTGPKLSPLGLFVTRVVTPRLPIGPKMVSGPPKRFAQGMGAVMSVTAVVLYFGAGSKAAAYGVLAVLGMAATLESVFAFCLGCKVFAVLMSLNLIPERVCAQCSDIRLGSAGDLR
ncbi:MAG: DUF4395 domain-containing protein [Actinomycetota bacterium]|nr:DUF4395 domain-containing protein [Actinomycetota bacterium]